MVREAKIGVYGRVNANGGVDYMFVNKGTGKLSDLARCLKRSG
jgi:hypothetical protein